jgi:pimeloyl-ACP methyl ester carboxylesterase
VFTSRFVGMFLLACLLYGCRESEKYEWNLVEQGILSGMIETQLDPGNPRCKEDKCTFQLHYFLGGNKFNKDRKTILYIAGGPGSVVRPDKRDLEFLEDDYNVVYFDIRGLGLSEVPSSNVYDKYLRANYVVEDVETLRSRLGIRSWDAIFAYSHGTIVAQLYANKYGGKNNQNRESRVKMLLLAAPVVGQPNIEEARRKKIISNLLTIYDNYRSQKCTCTQQATPPESNEAQPPKLDPFQTGTPDDDFCFLRPGQTEIIAKNLLKIMQDLQNRYKSFRLIVDNYYELLSTDFGNSFPFPKAFFLAFGVLEDYGSSKDESTPDEEELRKKQAVAAYVLGYYASIEPRQYKPEFEAACDKDENPIDCKQDIEKRRKDIRSGDFLPNKNFFDRRNANIDGNEQCVALWDHDNSIKLKRALQALGKNSGETVSQRAYYVYGMYDGVSRFLNPKADKSTFSGTGISCINSTQVKELVDSLENTVVKNQFRRIGVVPDENTCPWQPTKHSHGVRTVILRGKADPLTAGCQAEEIFNHGLKGDRVLIQYPGVGHDLLVSPMEVAFMVPAIKSLITDKPFREWIAAPDIKRAEGKLKFEMQTRNPETGEDIKCEDGS